MRPLSQSKNRQMYSLVCGFSELKEAVNLGQSLVGSSHIDYQTLERRFGICHEIVHGIYSSPDKSLKGYFILYPLSSSACDAINDRKIINGRGILDEHIEPGFDRASGLYIGMVGATNPTAKGMVLRALLFQLQTITGKGYLKYVYTRGATNAGHRVIAHYGFHALGSPSEIQRLCMDKGAGLSDRLSVRLSGRDGN